MHVGIVESNLSGSGFEGLGDTVGFASDDNESKGPQRAWDIACGLVLIISRMRPAWKLTSDEEKPFTFVPLPAS